MGLGKMIYKEFKFPSNPRTSSFECDRSYVKHKYPEFSGNELEDFGPNAIIITGSGEFFGENAYSHWDSLLEEFNKGGVGRVYHPIFKTITRGLMVRLKSNIEPRPNYIDYTFEIIADSDPTKKKISNSDAVVEIMSKSNKSLSDIKVGDIVNFTGNRHYISSYAGASSSNCKPGMAKVTNINKSGAYPYHLVRVNGGGSTVYGWVGIDSIGGVVDVKKSSSNSIVHTVVSGEYLSGICAHYSKKYNVSIKWKDVAMHNKLKNPDTIYPGQKITIIW